MSWGWLLNVLSLVPKQSDKEYATILYVEAICLLDELVFRFDSKLPLPDLPFPSERRGDPRAESEQPVSETPFWVQEKPLFAAIHGAVLDIDPGIICDLDASGWVAKYRRTSSSHPFLIVDGRKPHPLASFACSPDNLEDPRGLLRRRPPSKGMFGAVLEATDGLDILYFAGLAKQMFEQAPS